MAPSQGDSESPALDRVGYGTNVLFSTQLFQAPPREADGLRAQEAMPVRTAQERRKIPAQLLGGARVVPHVRLGAPVPGRSLDILSGLVDVVDPVLDLGVWRRHHGLTVLHYRGGLCVSGFLLASTTGYFRFLIPLGGRGREASRLRQWVRVTVGGTSVRRFQMNLGNPGERFRSARSQGV